MLTNEIYIGNMVQGKYGSVSYKTKQNKPRPQSEWYRGKEGEHLPDNGGGLLVNNQVAFLIGVFLVAIEALPVSWSW